MAITVATVPHMSRTLGGNNAEEIVNERFDFAQEYANGAFDDAQSYLSALQSIFNLPPNLIQMCIMLDVI